MSRKEMVEILTANGIKASLKDSTVRLERKMSKCDAFKKYESIMKSISESENKQNRTKMGKDFRNSSNDRKVRKIFKRIDRRIAKNGRSSVSGWMERILSADSPVDAAVEYISKKDKKSA